MQQILKTIELKQYTPFFVQNHNNFKFAHININSLRHKWEPLAVLLRKSMIDVLSIQECKLDKSFPNAQFFIQGFRLYRKDHKADSGGPIIYIRDDITQRYILELELSVTDSGRM